MWFNVVPKQPNKKNYSSGGLGREGYYEGDKMKECLLANKVPD